jgi:hypothetical protein
MTTMTTGRRSLAGLDPVPRELAGDWIPEGSGLAWLDELRGEHAEALEVWAAARERRDRVAGGLEAAAVDYRRAVSAAIEADPEQIIPDPPAALDPVRAAAVRDAHDLIVAGAAARVVAVVARVVARVQAARGAGELADYAVSADADTPAVRRLGIDRDVAVSVMQLVADGQTLGMAEPVAVHRARAAMVFLGDLPDTGGEG